MATFITIGYGDQDGYDATPDDVLAAAHEHDAALTRAGAVAGIAGTPCAVAGGVVEVWPLEGS